MSAEVVVVGSANADLVVTVDRHPGPGETVLGGDLHSTPGGKGANQAVAAARAGDAPTVFVGALGTDDAGEMLLASLAGAGVDTSLVARTPTPSGTAFIIVGPGGENAIVVAPGANRQVSVSPRAATRIGRAAVVLAQLEIPVETVVAAARARRPGALMVLNAAPSRELPDELWRELDVLVVNEHEAADLAGLAAEPGALAASLLARVPAVVVTLGADGCLVAARDEAAVTIPSPVVEAVDTTGAGDTFCGVLAAGLARGEDLVAASRRAVAAAALAVTRPGAQQAVPTAAETEAALATGGRR